MKSGMTLSALATELERQKAAKADYLVEGGSIVASEGATKIAFGGAKGTQAEDVQTFDTTETFRGQLAERTGVPQKYFDRMAQSAPALLDANVNHWLRADGGKRRLVRTLDGNARALLSDRYQRIDNAEVANVALTGLVAAHAEVVSATVTESRLYIKAVNHRIQREVKKGDVVEAGVMISNSEIGYGAVVVEAFALRLVCLNGMKVPAGSFRRHHVGRQNELGDETYRMLSDEALKADDNAVLLKARDIIAGALTEATLDNYVAMAAAAAGSPELKRPSKAIELLGQTRGFNEVEQEGILAHLIKGGDMSRWGLANAVTALAQDVDSYDRATELEGIGGQVMVANDWAALVDAA